MGGEKRMSDAKDRKTSGVVALWFGGLTLVASLAADSIGIGAGLDQGYLQLMGALLGAVVMIVGLALSLEG
jgi:hypothetical protein